MKILDLNLLLYAVNRDSALHDRASNWLDETLSGEQTVGLPWVVVLGFMRLSTSPRIFTRPLSVRRAAGVVDGWFARPMVVAVHPSDDHWLILRELLLETGAGANLTTDAHLAALAIQHGAELCSTDSDFARFERLRWTNPLRA